MTGDSLPSLPEQTVELLQRARRGDQDAMATIYTRYAPRVRGLVALRMGYSLIDFLDRDDIVQDSLLDALSKIDDFESRSEGGFICWLARFVESRVKKAWRAARAKKRGGGRVQRRADLGVTTLADQAGPGAEPSPSQQLAAREFDDPLERALLAIGDPYRQVVYCRLMLEMSHAEIAAELELASADSARAIFHKAVARLRARLDHPT